MAGSKGRLGMVIGMLLFSLFVSCQQSAQEKFMTLQKTYLEKYQPLWLESASAWWEATTTGSNEAFARKEKADKALVALHSDAKVFAELKGILEGGEITDPVERRVLEVMYKNYLSGQGNPELQNRIIELESLIEQSFNTFRSQVKDEKLSENQVRDILSSTADSAEAEAAWKGYMAVGELVQEQYATLVKLRNELARELGFANYYALQLERQEMDEAGLLKLFDELDALTREPFKVIKSQIDVARAKKFGVSVEELRPWHYGDLFFQEAPEMGDSGLGTAFEGIDILPLARRYFASIGLPCDDILDRSDLYEREGKSPHAFCSDLNREGDVRILCNIKPNLNWSDTTFHELGHGVYDKGIDSGLPFLLREAAHSLTTEGIALMFGSVVKNEEWLNQVLGLEAEEAARLGSAARETLRIEKLIFSRWAQVMVRFEQAIYTNPDQNAGELWWNLKQEYQLLNPPESKDRPDYAAKMHILNYPVYYHNYQMGDLFAAQIRSYIAEKVLNQPSPTASSFFGKTEVGDYLKSRIFAPGSRLSWRELIKEATGEELTAKHFAAQFVQ